MSSKQGNERENRNEDFVQFFFNEEQKFLIESWQESNQ